MIADQMKTMKTIKQLIEESKCRKGHAEAITKSGAYWLACDEIKLRSFGGDGIGNSGDDCRNFLQLRHFRDGSTKAVVRFWSWHQNSGTETKFKTANILDCVTVEEVVMVLKSTTLQGDYGNTSSFDECYMKELTTGLMNLGLAECLPAPDEE